MSKHEGKPSVLELEGNIRVAREWSEAISVGTYPGHYAVRIATLLDFLKGQQAFNQKQLEELIGVKPEGATVEFGNKAYSVEVAA